MAIVLTNLAAQTLAPGEALIFNQVRVKSGSNECWRNPSSSVKLRNKGIYEIDFSANIGGATAATPVQLAIRLGGEEILPETTMISVPAAAGDLNSVSTATAIRNCCCDLDRVAVVNAGTVPVDVGANSVLRIGRRNCS